MVELNRDYLINKYGKDELENSFQINLRAGIIQKIAPSTFNGLTKLETLMLNDNLIEQLDSRLFEGLSNLSYLEICGNKLKSIKPDAFKGLASLEILFLGHNEIEEIDATTFESLSNLKQLSLYDNRLKRIDAKCFEPLKSIEEIELAYNDDLKAFSFSTKPKNYELNKRGYFSDWNEFLKQFH